VEDQLSHAPPTKFKLVIDFNVESFSHQLAEAWHCHEREGRGFRWTKKEASCYLESQDAVRHLCLTGYSPHSNHLEVWVDAIGVGEHSVGGESQVQVEYLIPFKDTSQRIFQICICCDRDFPTEDSRNTRELGLMIFSIGLG